MQRSAEITLNNFTLLFDQVESRQLYVTFRIFCMFNNSMNSSELEAKLEAPLESVPKNLPDLLPSSSIKSLSEEFGQGRKSPPGHTLEFLLQKDVFMRAAKKAFFAQNRISARQAEIEQALLRQNLLCAIDRGNEDEVRKILDKLNSSYTHPYPLLQILSDKGAFRDHAGRVFHSITPLQFAAWNLDTPMRNLICGYMDKSEVALQIDELNKIGIDYSIPLSDFKRLALIQLEHTLPIQKNYYDEIWEILGSNEEEMWMERYISLNEKHYDWAFRVFQSALQTYIKVFRNMIPGNENYELLDKLWLDVGFTQHYLTVPFINAYCSETPFDPLPDFNSVTLARQNTFYNAMSCRYDKQENFFHSLDDQGLGVSCAIFKGLGSCGHPVRGNFPCLEESASFDLAALSHLYKVRIEENHELKNHELKEELQLEKNQPVFKAQGPRF